MSKIPPDHMEGRRIVRAARAEIDPHRFADLGPQRVMGGGTFAGLSLISARPG
ncbi:hypothetical protein [Sulfitobacter sp.]|uniref:hypothetical protein n=1 Tax=Sulfitobacter sp. TaxID=1903071 RepID=UPI00405826C8